MEVLYHPILSEKSITQIGENKYSFKVNINANKPQIAESVKELYKVTPVAVNIINFPSLTKVIRGKYKTNTKAWKKAIVTLKKGDKIPGFEIAE